MTSADSIWQAALGAIELEVNRPNFRTWFQGTRGISFHDGRFTVGVPNAFVGEYLARNQRSLIEKTLITLAGQPVQVEFQLSSGEGVLSSPDKEHNLNPRYTFANFVVGDCNRLAYAAATAVAQEPGTVYNPLFIYGNTGLGKTHLMQAIGHEVREREGRVVYATGEQFTNDFIQSLREKCPEDFRLKYRGAETLLIDDIQFISGKAQTEESFFHTFNELHNQNRQIVITADKPPWSLAQIEDRLRSRFTSGLAVTMQPPDLETRLAILSLKARESRTQMIGDVLEVIAREAILNVRELEGRLNRVIAYAKLLQAEPTPELAARAMRDITRASKCGDGCGPGDVIETVATSFNLSPGDLTSPSREKRIVLARQMAMHLLQTVNHLSLTEIGQIMGRRPSTVSHACEKMERDIENDPLLKHQRDEIARTLTKGH